MMADKHPSGHCIVDEHPSGTALRDIYKGRIVDSLLSFSYPCKARDPATILDVSRWQR